MAVQFTGDDIVRVLNTLEKPQAATLVRTVLGIDSAERFRNLGSTDLLAGGVWEFLLAAGFVSEIQALAIVRRMTPALSALALVTDGKHKTLPIFRLTAAERRWVTWPMYPSWFDFYTQEDVVELPEPPVLLVCCDVTALYLRLVNRLAKVRGTDAKPDGGG